MSTNTREEWLQSYWDVYFNEIDGLMRGFDSVEGPPYALYNCRAVVTVEALDGFVCMFYDNRRFTFRYAVLDQSVREVLAALTYPVQIEIDSNEFSEGAIVELGDLDANEGRATRFGKRTPCQRAVLFRGHARLDMSTPAARARARHDVAIAIRRKANRA
jgi:hypothetical protein